ncbi:MAG: alpha/beta hydrolase family protein [Anaerolineales bacterium]
MAPILLLLAALLAACAGGAQTELAVNAPDPAQVPASLPSATIIATPTAVTATRTPTLTPTPLNPISIEWMRQQDYPGSEIVIEETLASGSNYNRYIASYRSEGLKIFALLTVPRGEKPDNGWPVIVFNHGYIRPDQYRTTERYVAYVDGFARNGYIVIKSDYRGHGDSEGTARGGFGTANYTIDVLNAVASVKGLEEADPERVGMWGHSMGGGITLRAMVTSNDIKAGVIWAGEVGSYSDRVMRWAQGGAHATPGTDPHGTNGRQGLFGEYGSPEENPEFWDSISANAFLEDLSGPIQLHHGTADSTVPIEFSATLYDQIQAVSGSVEFFTYEGDNHNLSNYFSLAMQRSVAFFDTYVKGSAP